MKMPPGVYPCKEGLYAAIRALGWLRSVALSAPTAARLYLFMLLPSAPMAWLPRQKRLRFQGSVPRVASKACRSCLS